MKREDKINHIILLRAIAIILVVLAHSTRSIYSPNAHMYNPAITPWWEIAMKNYIYSFHMPLFFWISGFVFYFSTVENRKNDSVLTQLVGKVKRLILPMYSTSFLILLPTILLFGHVNGSLMLQIKLFILCSDNDHLWFLKILFYIFCFVIPLYGAVKTENKIFYIFISFLILYFYQSSVFCFTDSAIKYFPFFAIGSLFRKYEFILNRVEFRVYLIVFFTIHLFMLLVIKQDETYIHKDISWYLTAFFGIYLMYSLSMVMVSLLNSSKFWTIIIKIDLASYSIYLFHVSFLYIVLFIDCRFNINIPAFRVILSFIFGLVFPIILHELFSTNRTLSIAFAIPYRKIT